MLAGNITSEQAKAITEQLTGALSIKNKTSNATTANMTAPINTMEEKLKSMRNSVAKASNGCADTIDGCKRFKDAGICPFVSAFMNGACAKTCKTCASHSKTGILNFTYLYLYNATYSLAKRAHTACLACEVGFFK